jgi:hypothetical protein
LLWERSSKYGNAEINPAFSRSQLSLLSKLCVPGEAMLLSSREVVATGGLPQVLVCPLELIREVEAKMCCEVKACKAAFDRLGSSTE